MTPAAPAELHFPQAAPQPRGRSLIVFLALASERPARLEPPDASARIAELEADNARLRDALAYYRARAAKPIREHSATGSLLERLREATAAARERATLPESARRRAAVRRGDQLREIR